MAALLQILFNDYVKPMEAVLSGRVGHGPPKILVGGHNAIGPTNN